VLQTHNDFLLSVWLYSLPATDKKRNVSAVGFPSVAHLISSFVSPAYSKVLTADSMYSRNLVARCLPGGTS